ncbi:thymidine kinase [Myxococcota bacterium]|nr:thymidine kinase [Myxococcota bacterium]
MHHMPTNTGWIEVICGSMFSGKTEELISRLKRVLYAHRAIQVFKPLTDNRYATCEVVSHSDHRLACRPLASAREILDLLDPETEVVGIDECQFFGADLADVVQALADQGLRVICAGLDLDYKGEPFGPMPRLLAVAEFVTKKHAVCMICGNPAHRSQRLVAGGAQVLIGERESYQARCRGCHSAEAEPLAPPKLAAGEK